MIKPGGGGGATAGVCMSGPTRKLAAGFALATPATRITSAGLRNGERRLERRARGKSLSSPSRTWRVACSPMAGDHGATPSILSAQAGLASAGSAFAAVRTRRAPCIGRQARSATCGRSADATPRASSQRRSVAARTAARVSNPATSARTSGNENSGTSVPTPGAQGGDQFADECVRPQGARGSPLLHEPVANRRRDEGHVSEQPHQRPGAASIRSLAETVAYPVSTSSCTAVR